MDTPMVDVATNGNRDLDPNAASPLIKIPTEVLLQVTSYLTTPEYGSLRLTCKAVEERLLRSFTREFFTKRQFMFTEFSLQTLVDISKSRFSATLVHVLFGLERPVLESGIRQFGLPANSRDKRIQRNRVLQEYVGHMKLTSTGHDIEMLSEAFSNLENLQSVEMRDFYSRSRNRDYPFNQWRSYGVSTFERETGHPLEGAGRRHVMSFDTLGIGQEDVHISRIFLSLLRALGNSSARPRDFQVILRHHCLQDHAFQVPKYSEAVIEPVLARLHKIFFDVKEEFPGPYVDVDNDQSECRSYNLQKFLARIPQLEHLRVNFRGGHGRNTRTENLLSWLSKSNPNPTPSATIASPNLEAPPPVDFSNLKQIDLGFATTSSETLLAIIRKLKSNLRTISLHKITLVDHDPEKLTDKVNIWKELFRQLSKLGLGLTAMNMSNLAQELTDRRVPQQVTFNNTRIAEVRSWAGVDVQSGLRDLISDVTVNWIGYDPDSLRSEESASDPESMLNSDDDDGDED